MNLTIVLIGNSDIIPAGREIEVLSFLLKSSDNPDWIIRHSTAASLGNLAKTVPSNMKTAVIEAVMKLSKDST